MKDQKPKENREYWKAEEEKIIKEWSDKALCYQWLHSRCREIYQIKNAWFTIPVIIISTLTGTANFAQDRFPEDMKEYFVMGIGSLSIIAGIITTIYQFLQVSELNEGYRAAAIAWNKLHNNLKTLIMRHPLDRIISQWRHYRGRHPNCAQFDELTHNRQLRRLIIGCSMYYQRLMAFREFYPEDQIHCMTFEDLVTEPNQSLQKTLKFLGVKPQIKQMLDQNGLLPRENEAGAKGRDHVEKPEWNTELKAKVLHKIKPDAEQMLSYMGKPLNYWNL